MGDEIRFAGFGVAGDDVQELVFHTIGGGLIAREQEGGEILNLRVGQFEGWHGGAGAAV